MIVQSELKNQAHKCPIKRFVPEPEDGTTAGEEDGVIMIKTEILVLTTTMLISVRTAQIAD